MDDLNRARDDAGHSAADDRGDAHLDEVSGTVAGDETGVADDAADNDAADNDAADNDADVSSAGAADDRPSDSGDTGRDGQETVGADGSEGTSDDRADAVERQLTVPVLVAALASIPAVFLTRTGGATEVVGNVLNWASLAVLLTESAVLLWVSGSVRTWIRRYRWQLVVVAAAVPAVVFVVGPMQLLRVALTLGAFHIFRARRIVRAGQVVVRTLGLGTRRARWVFAGVAALATVFATIVLSDPDSRSRRVADWFVERIGVVPTVLVGIAAAGLVYAVAQRITRSRY